MINYYCPDFYKGFLLYKDIIKWKTKYPEYFYDNVNIKAIFGSFPNMIWNGGSVSISNKIFSSEIIEIKNFYKEHKIALQLTCTNSSISLYHLENEYCNNILSLLEDSDNHVLVSTDLMYNYIKKNYPLYKIDRSIVNTQEDYDWELALEKKYNNIVLPRRHCYNINFLNKIDNKYRNRIEILANDPCPISCPFINEHYKKFERLTLKQGKEPDYENALQCINGIINQKLIPIDDRYIITKQDIEQKYLPLNYSEFKLSGRGNIIKITESIIPYLIKPKYQINFFAKLMKELL